MIAGEMERTVKSWTRISVAVLVALPLIPVVRPDQIGPKKAVTLAIAEQEGIKNK